jgi:DeoR/GlpR family transcriptional regulator of sugar metabolism
MAKRSLNVVQVVATEIAALLTKHRYEWTIEELQDTFPDRSAETIRKALRKIEAEGLVFRGRCGWVRNTTEARIHHDVKK